MIEEVTYNSIPGSVTFTEPALAYSNILKVKRSGIGYDIVRTGTPGNRQVVYYETTGSFLFLNKFELENGLGEPIYFLIKR
jgi:hypothetical protein